MENSVFIAQLAGPVIAAFGLTMLINRSAIDEVIDAALHSQGLIIMAGTMTLLIGLVIVNTHNIWVSSWQVAITIFGWIAVIGGLSRMLIPAQVQAIGKAILKQKSVFTVATAAWIAFGLFLCYVGYLA